MIQYDNTSDTLLSAHTLPAPGQGKHIGQYQPSIQGVTELASLVYRGLAVVYPNISIHVPMNTSLGMAGGRGWKCQL